jgi:hypothetical protein
MNLRDKFQAGELEKNPPASYEKFNRRRSIAYRGDSPKDREHLARRNAAKLAQRRGLLCGDELGATQ